MTSRASIINDNQFVTDHLTGNSFNNFFVASITESIQEKMKFPNKSLKDFLKPNNYEPCIITSTKSVTSLFVIFTTLCNTCYAL